ncbi:hypothetical protein L596_016313 [Steinernema carpocapsae]|uniref:Uncharacterized protein n=1 Tax=Steinernema carpocapsae TaxID=34508 RepID=A0A4U5NIT4_STECR|nr:hypothetical protein L596_016313 [Steinernema carpocapsae]
MSEVLDLSFLVDRIRLSQLHLDQTTSEFDARPVPELEIHKMHGRVLLVSFSPSEMSKQTNRLVRLVTVKMIASRQASTARASSSVELSPDHCSDLQSTRRRPLLDVLETPEKRFVLPTPADAPTVPASKRPRLQHP